MSQVIIISSWMGYLVPAAALGAGFLYHFIKKQLGMDVIAITLLFYSTAALLAAFYLILGNYLDSKKLKNDFFFIPMRYYAGIVAVVLVVDFFVPFVER